MLEFTYWMASSLQVAIGWVFSSSWLPPEDFRFFRWLVVPGYGYGFVLITFSALELIIPQDLRPWNRSTLLTATYLMFTGKMGIYVLVVTPLVRDTWLYLGLPSLHLDRTLPLPLYMLMSLSVVTFTAYWAHRGMHRIPLFWHIHKIHHSVRNLNCNSVYQMHFLEYLLHAPVHLIAVLALGTDLVAPFGIIFKTIDVLGHSNVRLDLGWLSYVISTPQVHRIHHSLNPEHYDTNFGNTFMIWDHVFGTFRYDPTDPATEYGVPEYVPESFLKQQILPLIWIIRDATSSLLGLYLRFCGVKGKYRYQ
jgi:sterol desaturase/sphingolipid hydroxylase (fatty acid hydroxylase superfamily)